MPGADKCAVLSGPSANSIARYWLGFDEDYKDPWLIVTDLLPAQADVGRSGMRAWIECGENRYQTGGMELALHQDDRTCPRRTALVGDGGRHAVLWVVSVGGEVDAQLPESLFAALPERHIARKLSKKQVRKRHLSCFAESA